MQEQKKKLDIFIFGKKFKLLLGNHHDETHLKQLAASLENEISKMRKVCGSFHYQDLLTIVALNLLENLLFYQKSLHNETSLKNELLQRMKKILNSPPHDK